MASTSDTVVHIAGPPVCISGRWIQRCAVCGLKLMDTLNTVVPLNPDGTQPPVAFWELWDMVEVEEGNPTRYSKVGGSSGSEEKPYPRNGCISFVED